MGSVGSVVRFTRRVRCMCVWALGFLAGERENGGWRENERICKSSLPITIPYHTQSPVPTLNEKKKKKKS
jgi:hypothetical protein